MSVLSLEFFKKYILSARSGSLVRSFALISMAGVAIGLFALVLISSVMNGFGKSLRERSLAIEPHVVVNLDSKEEMSTIFQSDLVRQINEIPGTRLSLGRKGDVIIRTTQGFTDIAEAHGVDFEDLKFMMSKSHELNRDARDFDLEHALNLKPGEVLVGNELARKMDLFEGDVVTLVSSEALVLPSGEIPPFERLTVKGRLISNFADIDQRMIFYLREPGLPKMNDSAAFENLLEIRLENPERLEEVESILKNSKRRYQTWRMRNSALFSAVRLERITMSMVVGASAVIAAFSLFSFIVLLMTIKRKELGLLMAVGLSVRRVSDLFISIGLWLSACAVTLGVSFGVLTAWLVGRYSQGILPDFYYDTSIPTDIDGLQVLLIAVGFLAFCGASIRYVVTRNIPHDPVQALKKGQPTG